MTIIIKYINNHVI